MDLMKTVTETSLSSISPKEQLHRLNEQKKLDLENSLLKEALAESSGRCERLLAESNRLLATSEKNRKEDAATFLAQMSELTEKVKEIENADEILKDAIKDEMKREFYDLHKDVVAEINSALNERQKKVVRATDEMITDINAVTRRIKQAEEQLFRFDGIKTFVFWFGQIVNIVTFGLLIWWIFFR